MALFVRPLAVMDREELAALGGAHLPALEEGMSLLGRRFPAGRVAVDLVGVDSRERLVLVVLGSGSDPGMLLEALEAYGWCCENGALLGRLFPGARVDASVPPRVFLLAPRFLDDLRRMARYLGPLRPVLVECRALEVNGQRAICFEAVEGGGSRAEGRGVVAAQPEPVVAAPGPGDGARDRARRLVSHLERISFREAFR